MNEIKLTNHAKPARGIEDELMPFLTAVEWKMEDGPPPLAENIFPYTEVNGRRLYLANAIMALRGAFDQPRPTAFGRS